MEARGAKSFTHVMADLCACFERAVDRRRAIMDTREHWFVDCCVSPSSTASREPSLETGWPLAPH